MALENVRAFCCAVQPRASGERVVRARQRLAAKRVLFPFCNNFYVNCMMKRAACPSCSADFLLPDGLTGMLVQCPRCRCTFQAQPPSPPRPGGEKNDAKVYGLAELDEPVSVLPAADPTRPDPASYRWDRCGSCDELIAPGQIRCEYCGELRGKRFPRPRRDVEPHRAGLLHLSATISAITGVVSCALVVPLLLSLPLGMATWAFAVHDLAQMRDGHMDRAGLLKTQSARDTALIGVVMSIVSGGGWLMLLLWHFAVR